MPLLFAGKGHFSIIDIRGGKNVVQRLYDMGLIPGVSIEVVKLPPGPVYIKKDNERIALGQGLADKIIVRPIDG